MKRNKTEHDVDYIGGMAPLTKEEEKAISDFIKARKKKSVPKKRSAQHGLAKSGGRLNQKRTLNS
jgi:hypothetical protein